MQALYASLGLIITIIKQCTPKLDSCKILGKSIVISGMAMLKMVWNLRDLGLPALEVDSQEAAVQAFESEQEDWDPDEESDVEEVAVEPAEGEEEEKVQDAKVPGLTG